ncbi:MAG: MqnA/MqnD/SBP family protein [Polyangiaceae bacterium]
MSWSEVGLGVFFALDRRYVNEVTTLKIAFSPDSDDIFMFWPLLNGKVDAGPYSFEHVRADTQTLNEQAARGELDVCAISIGSYPKLQDKYLLLPHGGSVGRGYGPVVVASSPVSLESLRGHRVGIPGYGTTAYLVLKMLLPEMVPVVLPISPFSRAFEAVRTGEVDAALLIHEGRLTYEREGFAKVVDIGEAWAAKTGGLPLPLGGNAIRRGLGDEVIRDVSSRLRASIRWALDHRELLIEELLSAETRDDVAMTRALLDRYLAMYANDDTAGYPNDAREACDRLVAEGVKIGHFAPDARVDWAP